MSSKKTMTSKHTGKKKADPLEKVNWEPIANGDGDFLEWKVAGTEHAFAEYLGFEKSTNPKYSGVHSFKRSDGTVVKSSALTVLNKWLKDYPPATPLKVQYLGEEKSQETGNLYKNFKVYGPKAG